MKGIQHTLLSYAAAAVFLLALWCAIALLLALPIVPTPDKVLVRLAHVDETGAGSHAATQFGGIDLGDALARRGERVGGKHDTRPRGVRELDF